VVGESSFLRSALTDWPLLVEAGILRSFTSDGHSGTQMNAFKFCMLARRCRSHGMLPRVLQLS
jgi:hypothetical protein